MILSDIGLPGMSGYDVAKVLRANEPTGVLLIAVSRCALPEDAKKAVEGAFDGHVAKPCDTAQIQRLHG